MTPHDSATDRPEKWVHLSDLHFGTETPAVCAALCALIERENPRGLVVSGDVTQRAKPREFRAAAEFLGAVSAGRCLLVVPGNHDLPLFRILERALSPYRWFESSFGPVAEVRTVDEGHFRFVLINTTRSIRHKQGTLDPEQIEQVTQALLTAPSGHLRALVLHHPLPAFDDVGKRFMGEYATQGLAERAVRAWAEAGLDLVFCGHTHHPRILRLTQPVAPILPDAHASIPTPPQAAPHPRQTPWLIQAGTSLSRRLRREPNSLYLLVATPATPPGLHLERWDYSPSSQKFERMTQLILN